MNTRYNLDQTVWFFDLLEDRINSGKVVAIQVGKEGEVCLVDVDGVEKPVLMPVGRLFSAREQCRAHYLGVLGG